MPQYSMDAESYTFLKSYAAEQGVSMAAVLRTMVAAFKANPLPVPSTADARARGAWYVVAYVWIDERLEHSQRATLASTAELPALAESVCKAASVPFEGVADYVRAELPRFRQNLARVQSSSLRASNGPWLCQLDVYRDPPSHLTTLDR